MGYLIEPPVPAQIVQAKVTITQAQLLAGGVIIPIPEFDAISSKIWVTSYLIAQFTGTPYVGTGTIHIETLGASSPQFRFAANSLTGSFMKFAPIITPTTNVIQFNQNRRLEIHVPTAFTGGTGSVQLYIVALLFDI